MTHREHLSGTLFDLLDRLRPETAPIWGKMNAQQMVEHLALPFGLALGFVEVPVAGTPEQVEKRRWHTFVNRTPIPRDLRVPFVSESPAPTTYADIQAAVSALREIVDAFLAAYDEDPKKTAAHPLLGHLDRALWEDFLWNHCSHHLRQFGLLPEE